MSICHFSSMSGFDDHMCNSHAQHTHTISNFTSLRNPFGLSQFPTLPYLQPTSHPKNNRSPIERGFVSSLPQQGIPLSTTDFQTQKLGYWVLATDRAPDKRTLLGTPGNLLYLISCPNEKPLSCSKWVRQVVGTHGTRKRQEDRSPGDFCSKSVQFQLAVVPKEA